ncbi:TPA: hypothetical protein QDB15_001144 [Burkholderia vietnamiensis]|uniref:hypothetical protein n=1 Tax=Burkholderia vietnamiensis TaxID=60552 RepID=UPI001ABA2EB2|nr:hypothetical protein [Burkholderia vietnamiensis]MCA8210369.1 hypothetical protein [Burkholderia vietnamiensis]HDR9100018.1 hypothetical protein [Burkholderia vietnamiensis]HDR9117397.1 hypothetical protein [Burkholderia vietnamiensis]
MTTDNEKGPLNQMESGQEKRSASEARALSEIVNGTPSENLCRRGSPAPEQASETTAQQPRTYTTQPAESVMGIALRQCGNEMEWRHILACNPEFARMLPHEYFPVGTVLNLPPHPAAASRFEKPEKSLAPEGRSEARGRWIQANCPTGDIIESPSPSNNREFPTSISENDCEHRIALAPSQPAAAPIDERPCIVRDDCKWPACRLDCIIDSRGQKAREGKSLAELTAPAPADERAATFEEFRDRCEHYHGFKDETDDTQCTCPGNNRPGSWCEESDCPRRSRAASANETGAEGAKPVAWAAEIIDALQGSFDTEGITENDSGDALIRLSSAIAAVEEVAESRSPAMAAEAVAIPAAVLDALRFYANGSHFNIDHDHQDFDTVSGEPMNWLYSTRDDDTTMIEDGSIAKAALCGKPLGFEDPETPLEGEVFTAAPQPAQAAMPALTNAMRAVITNESGAYQSADDLYAALCAAADDERPAQADARVGLTDEQREAIQRAIDYADMSDRDSDAEALRALLATPLPEPRAEATAAARDVLCERRRQAEQEGWTPEHDEKHRDHELSCAAGCYAMHTLAYPAGDPPPAWPWAADWWKPTTHRRNLMKAGALILAEIEKIDRATARSGDAS